MERHEGGNPTQPELVVDLIGESFGLAKVVEDLMNLPEGPQRTSEVQSEIDSALDRFSARRETGERCERVLETCDRLPVGRASGGLRSSLTAIPDGFLPHLAP